ncbi:hypothetical protein HS088_TW02G00328 [Tripterygium wilfordii]|uniref:Nodulin-like domain-containing protein n=1 Tax=Tripterygium wilfordii TaxID=458696 RepID=A0A7J7DY67_TRIWF|nr:protein NUCLEAR FUSION DEFECTIVE 4-like [Tripterygium wilfordii]KAF5751315.1 hypothetical protein HS088_TW02G00328 [Tripterygium wilfordii]
MPSNIAFRWLSLVAVIWLQSVNGTNTNFPAYSSQLKHLLSLSQIQVNNLAFASDAAKLLGWLSGIAAVYLPLWLVLLIGSTLGLVGYGVQYLFLTNQISSLSYAHIFCLTVLAGNSICWINTVCYVVAIRNFPSNRQVANGLTTSFQGLSAKIYTDIVDVAFNSSPTKRAQGYVLLNSVLPVIVSVICASLAKDVGAEGITDMKFGLFAMFIITIITGVYAILSSFKSISRNILSPVGILVGIYVLLLLPLVIPLIEKLIVEREKRVHVLDNNVSLEELESGDKAEEEAREVVKEEEVGVMEEIGVQVMVKRVNFWLYFFVYLLGVTLGLVFLNNLGQIAESRHYQGTSYLVSLSSSFSFFGRLLPSLLDFCFSRSRYMISRPASIVASMAPMVIAFFLLLIKTNLALYISTAVIALCTGAITTLSVSTTTELFGAEKFSINHNIVIANIPIGSLLFGYSAALIYHKHANGHGKCLGMECYAQTFIVWGSLCFVGTLLALALYFRTRKFYSTRVNR